MVRVGGKSRNETQDMSESGIGVCALIPARGGSKGLPGKNIRPFLGRPLLAWTIQAARDSQAVDRIVVSTDCPDIADVARRYGAEVAMRPHPLATDEATSADVARHHLGQWAREGTGCEVLALLQPTSPLRAGVHIDAAVGQFRGGGYDSLASCREAETHPYLTWRMEGGSLEPFILGTQSRRRQDLPPAYALNGALYLVRSDAFPSTGDAFLFGKCGAYVMEGEVSSDIDDLNDFVAAESVARRLDLTLPRSGDPERPAPPR